LKSPPFKNVSSVYIDTLQKVTKIGNSYFPYKNINVIYIAIKLSVRLIFIHLIIQFYNLNEIEILFYLNYFLKISY